MRGPFLLVLPIIAATSTTMSSFLRHIAVLVPYVKLVPPHEKQQQQEQKNKQTRDSLSIRSSGTGRPSTVCEDFCSDSRAVTTLRGKHQWAEALEQTKIEEKKKPMSSSLSIHMLFTVFLTREHRPGEPGHGDNFALSAECSGV